MKKLFLSLLMFAGFSSNAQVARTVIVEHFTNTYCSVCASRNPGFYTNLSQFPQVLHIAYHPSAPYPACPLNQHNKPENDARPTYYGVFGGTPRIVIQGTVLPANANYADATIFQTQLGQTTAFEVRTSLAPVNATTVEVTTVVKKVAASSLSTVELYAAIVEDTLFFNANNGETKHYDVFRKSVYGAPQSITAPANVGDSVVQTLQLTLNAVWDKDRIYVIGILQDANKSVLQASKSNHLPKASSILQSQTGSIRIHPNPVRNQVNIEGLTVATTYTISDMQGSVVRKGETVGQIELHGIRSGVYALTILSADRLKVFKIIKE